MKKFLYHTLIRESHLDTFGHVNNAKYLEILEEARWDFITANGYGLADVKARQEGPVILAIEIKFKKELRLRETIRVESEVTHYKGRIAKMTQQIFNGAGELSCDAVLTFGLFDLKARRLITPNEAWSKALGLAEPLAPPTVDSFDSASKS